MNLWYRKLAWIIAAILLPGFAMAHGLMPSLLHLQTSNTSDGQVTWQGRLRIAEPLLQEQTAASRNAIAAQLPAAIQLQQKDTDCPLQFSPAGLEQGERFNRVVFHLQGICPSRDTTTLSVSLFQRENPQHKLIAHIRTSQGQDRFETITTGSSVDLGFAATSSHPFATFLADGFKHILSGLDHVAFVLAILLATGWHLRRVLAAVTAFTLAHTLTLVLASLALVQPAPAVVEPVIAFSIAITALDGYSRQRTDSLFLMLLLTIAVAAGLYQATSFPLAASLGLVLFSIGYRGLQADRLPGTMHTALLPFLFGLAHGLGFAGPLQSLSLPTTEMAIAIFSFNLGVEAGQVAVILVLLTATKLLADRIPEHVPLIPVARAAVAGAGGAWFLQRVLSLG